ncbi:hypothetical protein [Pseudomonas nicosulfuronedens]
MKTISYKMEYSILEFVFGLIGPVIIACAIFFPIPDMKIGNMWLNLPEGVANWLLGVLGVFVTFLTVRTLLVKRAANSQGACIKLAEQDMTFTSVKNYRAVQTVVNYEAITAVVVTDIPETNTTVAEKYIEITFPSLAPKKFQFDEDCMEGAADYDLLLHTLKHRANKAVFEEIKA